MPRIDIACKFTYINKNYYQIKKLMTEKNILIIYQIATNHLLPCGKLHGLVLNLNAL